MDGEFLVKWIGSCTEKVWQFLKWVMSNSFQFSLNNGMSIRKTVNAGTSCDFLGNKPVTDVYKSGELQLVACTFFINSVRIKLKQIIVFFSLLSLLF